MEGGNNFNNKPEGTNVNTHMENSNNNFLNKEKKLSKCLLILNLQRPFANSALESLLTKYGKLERFWIDYKKTHCYVEYTTIEKAKIAKENLNGIRWPSDGKVLSVDFFPENEIDSIFDKNQDRESEEISGNNNNYSSKEKDRGDYNYQSNSNFQNNSNNMSSSNPSMNKNIAQNYPNNNTTNPINIKEEPVKTLDSLFKKTETKPHIYYLPLTEEEVEEKRRRNKRNQREN